MSIFHLLFQYLWVESILAACFNTSLPLPRRLLSLLPSLKVRNCLSQEKPFKIKVKACSVVLPDQCKGNIQTTKWKRRTLSTLVQKCLKALKEMLSTGAYQKYIPINFRFPLLLLYSRWSSVDVLWYSCRNIKQVHWHHHTVYVLSAAEVWHPDLLMRL